MGDEPAPEPHRWIPLARGNTKPAAMKGGVPLVALPLVFGAPVVLSLLFLRPHPLILILPLWRIVRSVCGNNPNKPRELWIGLSTGSIFAGRDRGGETLDPHGTYREI